MNKYLQDHLSLILWHITMHYMWLLLYFAATCELVGFFLSLTKYHSTTMLATVHLQDITDCGRSVVIAALNSQMLKIKIIWGNSFIKIIKYYQSTSTVVAVFNLESPIKSINLKSDLMYFWAVFLTQGGHVAEKNKVCALFDLLSP